MAKFLRRRPQTLHQVLTDLGFSEEEIAEADAAGTAELLAIDGVVVPERPKYTLDEVAGRVGVDAGMVRAFWRALGFVEPIEGEPFFSKRDVEIVRSLADLVENQATDPALALRVTRVMGVSMAQIATAVVDSSETRLAGDQDVAPFAVRAPELLPFMTEVIDYTFRRHLRAAARRRLVLATAEHGVGQVVGFADLVRFSELSMQLDEHELAEVIERFDELANEVLVGHGGRVVKMIGDAAMFTLVDPHDAALAALDLAARAGRDGRLPGLRIGMARGPVLSQDGDLFGPVVNVASRLVEIGRAGAINVSPDLRAALAGDPRFSLRSLGTWKLRHIGDLRVYRLRPALR